MNKSRMNVIRNILFLVAFLLWALVVENLRVFRVSKNEKVKNITFKFKGWKILKKRDNYCRR